ncbi:MAG: hypothetical protein COA50_01450 [Flavobacteriaceae bacterium]|nr:MAG: hypothetical protein COA50_01450 [Flavobacteriaceae bacterium]
MAYINMLEIGIQIEKLHPIFVHLPIGTIVFAFLLELYALKKPSESMDEIGKLALSFSLVCAILSFASGWFLGKSGDYEPEMLSDHKWMAAFFVLANFLLLILRIGKIHWFKKVYLPLFGLTLLLVGVTGHLGGNMTHGTEFLFTPVQGNYIVITDIEKAKVYADIIQPIFDFKCSSCHNQNKKKGGLIINSQKGILNGGDSGNILDSFEGGPPQLLTSLSLPIAHEDHMPPKGKIQLSSEEITLINWWVDQGSCFDCFPKDLKRSKKIAEVLIGLEQDTTALAVLAGEMDFVSADKIKELQARGIPTYPLAKDNPLLSVNLSYNKKISSEQLNLLKGVAENVVELNLGYSNFSDTLSPYLKKFKNLVKLQLQQTPITDETIEKLKKHEWLESLNAYGTDMSTSSLETLKKLKRLKVLYVWNTQISEIALEQLAAVNPKLNFGIVADSVFAATTVEGPIFVADNNFFQEQLKVKIESYFEGVSIYYTLDGTKPDTTSLKYREPLILNESTQLKAVAHKTGWALSEITKEDYTHVKFKIAEVVLSPEPHEKYPGKGAVTLADLKRGSTNFVDGNWLGYEATHMETVLELKEQSEISSISVGALSAPSSWIFFPVGAKVWTSLNGVHYKKIAESSFPKEKPSTEVNTDFFSINFPKTAAKFIKVRVNSPLTNPAWHPNPGGSSWMFIDEIIVN